MRFKQFINEDEHSFENGLSLIRKNCQPWMKACHEKVMYRGMNTHSDITHLDHPEWRPAKNSDPWFNAFFNAGCDLAFGIDTVRFTSVFMTGDRSTALEYGPAHAIFPVGSNFEILWSPDVDDSYVNEEPIFMFCEKLGLDRSRENVGRIMRGFQYLMQFSRSPVTAPSRFINDETLSKEMFKNVGDGTFTHDFIKEALSDTFKELYKTDDVSAAISSRNEVLMYRSEGFYVVSMDRLKNHIDAKPELHELREMTAEEALLHLLS